MQVAIIGTGIAGLTTALLLKEQFKDQDIKITIYEQRDSLESIGGGLSIWPNGAQVLLNLSCASAIKELAGGLREEYWGNPTGDTLRIVDRELLLQINGSPFMNICRSELQGLLLSTFGKENVVFGAKVTEIKKNNNGATVHFSNGEQIQADLVIGADGTFSTVRGLIFPAAKLEYAGYIALVGICKFLKNEKPKHHVIWGKNRLLLNFPIANDRHMVYTIRPIPNGDLKNKHPSKEQQFLLFYGWSDEVDNILTNLKNSLCYPELSRHYFCNENHEMLPLPVLHRDRVVLIGDAAHPMGSIMGLGTNKALEDAKALAQHLSNEKNIEMALENFSLKQTHRIGPMINLESEKKKFLLEVTDKKYTVFKRFVKSAQNDVFFGSLFAALR